MAAFVIRATPINHHIVVFLRSGGDWFRRSLRCTAPSSGVGVPTREHRARDTAGMCFVISFVAAVQSRDTPSFRKGCFMALATATTLFEQLGGAPAIEAVVKEFYRRVLGDDELKGYFDGIDMDIQTQ